MGVLENKNLAARFVDECFNKGNLSFIDQFATQNLIEHLQLPGLQPGREGLKTFIAGFRAAFPDLHYTVEDVLADGDKVIGRAIGHGTMKRDFMGMPASGKAATWEEIHITRFAEGKAAEHWGVIDQYSMFIQLGFISQGERQSVRR